MGAHFQSRCQPWVPVCIMIAPRLHHDHMYPPLAVNPSAGSWKLLLRLIRSASLFARFVTGVLVKTRRQPDDAMQKTRQQMRCVSPRKWANHKMFDAIFFDAVSSRSGHRSVGYRRSRGRRRSETLHRSSGPSDVGLCAAFLGRHFFYGACAAITAGVHGSSGPVLRTREDQGPQTVLVKKV